MKEASLLKILDMYKNETLDCEEAEGMLDCMIEERISKMVKTVKLPDDGKLRIVVARGCNLISKHEHQAANTVIVEYLGETLNVECWGNLTCGNVHGNAAAGGSINSGNIHAKASAGGSIMCGDIDGNVSCGGSVTCGKVTGRISAGGGVKMD